mmetsp:Transcript_92124/g.259700  ORF Transcript_92124/g.259700 Transcript_92124/m.259700 type:complete len:268 (-) Transcript_92124:133-936(-)
MASVDPQHMPASLAAVQAAGALSLELEAEDGAALQGRSNRTTPVANGDHSPWAKSSCGSPGSPWSPVTPAVNRCTSGQFCMPKTPTGSMPRSPASATAGSPQLASAVSPTRRVVVVPSSALSPNGKLMLPVSIGRSPQKHRVSFAQPPPTSPKSPGMTLRKTPAAHLGQSPMSPVSPGAAIRKNAFSLGIPLNLRTSMAEVSNPVPVRSVQGIILAPTPTARVAGYPAPQQQPTVVINAASAAPPPSFLRSIATPLSRPKHRAAGGA